MEIGEKVKKVRELRNYTQEYVAQELGITQESYSRIEANKSTLTIQRLDKIAEVLKVNVFDLLSFDEKYIFQESFHNQQHSSNYFGNASNKKEELYERIIEQQKNEIEFLKSLLKKENNLMV
jgi:transcriptional regulator with XRE-family HTH domain